MWPRMTRERKLLALLMVYGGLVMLVSSLNVMPFTYGLSTVMGTFLLASSMLSSSVMVSSLFGGVNAASIFSNALLNAEAAVTVLTISLLAFAEVSSPAYGKAGRLVTELRRGWMPIAAFVVLLFAVTVASKIILFIH